MLFIRQKSVRSVDRYLSALQLTNTVRLVTRITPELHAAVSSVGFSDPPSNGETILPSIVGQCSGFNAEGKHIPLKDKPKECRYITTMEWTWKQWRGRGQTETVTEQRDIYRDCYPRKELPPPAIELTLIIDKKRNETLVVSPKISIKGISPDLFKHIINLFLELFGECEIRKEDFSPFVTPATKRVNWEILPPGKYPWDKVQRHVKTVVSVKNARYSNVILERQSVISSYEPDEVFIGRGGFQSYVAYVFDSRKLVVLESVVNGNATYVFGENWEDFSMLSKAEILDNQYQEDRLIHSKGWDKRLADVLEPSRKLAV